MQHTERVRIANDFGKQVLTTPDRVLAFADLIQEKGKQHADLIVHCKFGRSMQVRRLRSVRWRSWNPSDFLHAQDILDEIAALKKHADKPDYALALAVLGVEVDALNDALALLKVLPDELPEGEKPAAATPRLPEPKSGKATK